MNYHKLGLGRAEPELGDLERITEKIVRVAVRWTFYDRADVELTDCTYVYVLRDDGMDLRIHVAISVDEPEKILDFVDSCAWISRPMTVSQPGCFDVVVAVALIALVSLSRC